jgi:predicted O-methyltransferase YrrM
MRIHSRCGPKSIILNPFSSCQPIPEPGPNYYVYTFQLAKKYLHYYFTAANARGHGVHSPFVFSFIKNVLRDRAIYPDYGPIEARRRALLENRTVIEVEDFGAGSGTLKSKRRVVRDIARSSLKPTKFAQLLYRVARHYQPQTIIELGTSLGITTSYLALGNKHAKVYTCEGAASIASIARQGFNELQIKNIELLEGDFAKRLPALLNDVNQVDLVFVDGNHRKEPTVDYFHQLLEVSHDKTILVFDDIHWSEEMEAAWAEIQQHPKVTLTIDMFFIGLVIIDPGIKVKQHFAIRF